MAHYFEKIPGVDPYQQAVAFMWDMASLTLSIPKRNQISALARHLHIAHRISEDPSTENVRRVAQFHGMTMRETVKTYASATGESVMKARKQIEAGQRIRVKRGRIILPKKIKDAAGQQKMWE